jgi:hypothetical protein
MAIYQLNLAQYGATGTIVTDGTMGDLVPSNILDWSITIFDHYGNFFDLNTGNSYIGYTFGPDLVADAAGLHWNFTARDGEVFDIQTSSNAQCSCYLTLQTNAGIGQTIAIYDSKEFSLVFNNNLPSSLIATPVPEPATWALMLLGFVVMATRRKRCWSR